MGIEKNYDNKPTPKNIFYFLINNAAVRIVFFIIIFILLIGTCVNNCISPKEKEVYRYEIKTSNWVGSTYYKSAWYERTDYGTYIIYNNDSTEKIEIEVGDDWKIEIKELEE